MLLCDQSKGQSIPDLCLWFVEHESVLYVVFLLELSGSPDRDRRSLYDAAENDCDWTTTSHEGDMKSGSRQVRVDEDPNEARTRLVTSHRAQTRHAFRHQDFFRSPATSASPDVQCQ